MKIIGLMACDRRGLIGKGEAIPWDCPADLAHFRAITSGQIMIMGRKTFAGLPPALVQNRYSVVFSKKKHQTTSERVFFLDTIPDALNVPGLPQHSICYMIGGAEVAAYFLQHNRLSEFILTHLHKEYDGDVFLPEVLTLNWPRTLIQQATDFSIYHYINPRSSDDFP